MDLVLLWLGNKKTMQDLKTTSCDKNLLGFDEWGLSDSHTPSLKMLLH